MMPQLDYFLLHEHANTVLPTVHEAVASAGMQPLALLPYIVDAKWMLIRPLNERSRWCLTIALAWLGLPYEAFEREVAHD